MIGSACCSDIATKSGPVSAAAAPPVMLQEFCQAAGS